jgi:hypothetical protein
MFIGETKTPILRRIFKMGDSEGITLPKSWLDLIEHETGKRPTEVTMEVNGILKVAPVIEKTIGA